MKMKPCKGAADGFATPSPLQRRLRKSRGPNLHVGESYIPANSRLLLRQSCLQSESASTEAAGGAAEPTAKAPASSQICEGGVTGRLQTRRFVICLL